MGTSTSLIKSPISSAFIRFSMLSLTFCSWPERVWMTNHWLRMIYSLGLRLRDQAKKHREDEVHKHGKAAKQHNGNGNNHSRAFEFVPAGPGAFAQLFTRLLHVSSKAHQVASSPQPDERATNNHHPYYDPNKFSIHLLRPKRRTVPYGV